MSDIAFTPSFGNRPTRLVGRDQIVRDFINALDSRPGSKNRALVILGQRGNGKTVLLWEFADRAREHGFVVATPTSVREGLLERIVEKISDDNSSVLRESNIRVSGGSVGALGISASLQLDRNDKDMSAEHKLTKLCRKLTDRGLGTLILVDELQANSPEIRSLVGTYQELVGEGLNVAIVLAGLPACVSNVLNDRVLTFLNRARKINLGPIAIGEVDAFFRQAFRSAGVSVSSDIRYAAAKASKGSPYLMQLIGHYLCLYAEDAPVNESVLHEALESSREEFQSDVCSTTLAALSQVDISFLHAMAELGGSCRTREIASRMGVTPDYAQQYRKRLIDAGVIVSPARGLLRIDVPYLTEYLIHSFE